MDESKMSEISVSNQQNSEIVTNNETDKRTSPNQNNDKKLSPIGSDTALNAKDSPKKTKKITITYGASEKTIGQTP